MSQEKVSHVVSLDLIGLVMIVATFIVCLSAYFTVSRQIAVLDLQRPDLRTSMENFALLLTMLSVVTLLIGAVAGYLIGRYRGR